LFRDGEVRRFENSHLNPYTPTPEELAQFRQALAPIFAALGAKAFCARLDKGELPGVTK
jgi:hypothetical protein